MWSLGERGGGLGGRERVNDEEAIVESGLSWGPNRRVEGIEEAA